MKTFYSLLLALTCLQGRAQFTGAYNPSKWAISLSPGSNGTVNASGAPDAITITGSDGAQATNINTDYTITAIATGVWSFHWAYHTNDSDADPQYDLAGVLINGVFTQLTTNTTGLVDQSGTYTQTVTAGTTIGFRIQAIDNIFGNATFTISSFSPPGGVLPLKLTSFTAKPQQQNVLLSWTSAFEQNFSHFLIERSSGGMGFTPVQTIHLNTSGNYNYLDETATGSLVYYRLQIVDRDGHFTYSPVLPVKRTANNNAALFPNPAHNTVSLRIVAERTTGETLTVYSASGAVLKTEIVNFQQGSNVKQLDISMLPKGLYFIRLNSSQSLLYFTRQ